MESYLIALKLTWLGGLTMLMKAKISFQLFNPFCLINIYIMLHIFSLRHARVVFKILNMFL